MLANHLNHARHASAMLGAIAAIGVMSGCATMSASPGMALHGVEIYKVGDGEYEAPLFPAATTQYLDTVENLAVVFKQLCGADNVSIASWKPEQKATEAAENADFKTPDMNKYGYRATCLEPVTALPRVISMEEDPPAGAAVVTFVNTSGLAFDRSSGLIHVSIDGKKLALAGKKQAVTMALLPGAYELTLMHKDVGTFEETYTLEVTPGRALYRIWATLFSTKFEAIEALPDNAQPYLIAL